MDAAYPLTGFLVGALVGFTGMGGGSVMTPLLILLFGVNPVTAVGTDLLFAAVTKATGTRIHAQHGNVDWKLVGCLACGSVPATIATIVLMSQFPVHSPALTNFVTVAIGLALVLAAGGLLLGQATDRLAARATRRWRAPGLGVKPAARTALTVFLGVVLGVLVSMTSVGAGAVGIVLMRQLYPRLTAARLVGSDLAHAVPLTLLAGTGHWFMGDVHWGLLAALLLGSIPGIILASRYAHHVPDRILRRLLGLVLLGIAAPMVIS